jgi:coatomer subunit beta
MTIPEPAHKTLYINFNDFEFKDNEILKKNLQSSSDSLKIEAMQDLLISSSNDESKADELLMDVIKFVMPSNNKKLKKLCLLFLENVGKYDSNGNMKHEMILVWYPLINLLVMR